MTDKEFTVEEYENHFGTRWVFPLDQSILDEKISWNGAAKSFIELNPLWYDRAGLWWAWSHTRKIYEQIDETDLMIMIDRAVKRNNLRSNVKAEVLEAFRREARKTNPKEPPTTWVQFGSVIYDIETGEEKKPNSKYFMTNRISWPLGDTENTPIIDQLLTEWAGEKMQTLKELLSYCTLRDYPLHRIFLLIGSGCNGKGSFLNLLSNFIGRENTTSTQLDLLLSNHFQLAKLHKKLACLMGETNFNELKNTSMLKSLSGGDLIGFEYKNKLPFDDKNYAKIIVATNSLPITHDKTDGFYRRWIIIDFKNKFGEAEDVLKRVPEEEYKALARYALGTIKRLLQARKFWLEGSIDDRKEAYESRSNPVKAFLNENYEKNTNGMVSASDFFDHLSTWLQNRGHRQLTYQAVRNIMKEEGYEYERHRTPLFDNPATMVVGLNRCAGVQAVQAYSSSKISIVKTNTDVPAHLAQPAQMNEIYSHNEEKWLKCVSFMEKNPVGNAWMIDEVIGVDIVKHWLNEGRMFENPAGTYRLL